MDKDIKPGQFHTESVEQVVKPLIHTTPDLEFSASSIAIYTAFKELVYVPSSVLYPSCGFDASPSSVFTNVTFVDSENGNEGCIETLKHRGLKAIKQDIREYKPSEMHDLLILLNPSVPYEWATRHLSKNGWIIANNYHNTAQDIKNDDNFRLLGSIDFVNKNKRKKDNKVLVSRNLEGLLEPVKDMQEFRVLRPKEFKFVFGLVNSWIAQEQITSLKNASLDEKYAAYSETIHMRMPNKRVADRYLFVKK